MSRGAAVSAVGGRRETLPHGVCGRQLELGVKAGQRFAGAVDFSQRGIGPVELSQHRREMHAGMRRFERRTALLEEVHRVFELAPRGLEIAGGQGYEPCGKAGRGKQRRCVCGGRNASQLVQRGARTVQITCVSGRRVRADEHFQGGARSVRFLTGSRRR